MNSRVANKAQSRAIDLIAARRLRADREEAKWLTRYQLLYMPSIPDRLPKPSGGSDDRDHAELVKQVCLIRGYRPDYLPDWMQKRDYIGALHGFLGVEDETRSRLSKLDLVALYTVCYGSGPADGTTVGELRVAIADVLHYQHDYTEGGDGLRMPTLQYGVLALAANHLSEQESVTAETISMPKQTAEADNEYSTTVPNGNKKYTREDLLTFLRDLAEKNDGDPVTSTTIKRAEGPSVATLALRFGGIPEAREAAGLEAEPTAGAPRKYSDDDILHYVRDLAARLGHPPNQREIRNASGVSLSTIRSRLGSLEDTREAAEVGHPESEASVENGEVKPNKRSYERDALIDHLQQVTDALGHPPTGNEINNLRGPSTGPYYREFDSIETAREAAGVGHPLQSISGEPSSESESESDTEPDSSPDYDRDELITYLKELAEELGKPPSISDIKDTDGPSSGLFYERFGGIVTAREEAGVGHPRSVEQLLAFDSEN